MGIGSGLGVGVKVRVEVGVRLEVGGRGVASHLRHGDGREERGDVINGHVPRQTTQLDDEVAW